MMPLTILSSHQHQVVVFGCPDVDATGNAVHPKLIKQTLRTSKHYPIFTVLCSHRQEPLNWNRAPQDVATSWLLRERRAIDFADATKLTLSVGKRNHRRFDDLYSRVRELVKVDHDSFWVSPTGALFLLNELYDSWEENQCIFSQAGLIQIRIPVCLAPWGGIDYRKGAKPTGRSYLYCDASNNVEMAEIVSRLSTAALTAPSFDDTTGVSYV